MDNNESQYKNRIDNANKSNNRQSQAQSEFSSLNINQLNGSNTCNNQKEKEYFSDDLNVFYNDLTDIVNQVHIEESQAKVTDKNTISDNYFTRRKLAEEIKDVSKLVRV